MDLFDVDVYLVNGEVEHHHNVVKLTTQDGALHLQGQYMDLFDVDVYLVNGEVEHHHNVVKLITQDGALHFQGQYTAYEREHLASYPITSVLKWKILRP